MITHTTSSQIGKSGCLFSLLVLGSMFAVAVTVLFFVSSRHELDEASIQFASKFTDGDEVILQYDQKTNLCLFREYTSPKDLIHQFGLEDVPYKYEFLAEGETYILLFNDSTEEHYLIHFGPPWINQSEGCMSGLVFRFAKKGEYYEIFVE